MTQIELANKLFVTSKAVSRWERGVGFPDINTLEPLACALELTVTELVSCKKSSNNQLVEDVLNIVKEEDKVNIRKHKRTLLIILLGLIVTIFLHVVTFSNHESGWMICFILAFLSAISNAVLGVIIIPSYSSILCILSYKGFIAGELSRIIYAFLPRFLIALEIPIAAPYES